MVVGDWDVVKVSGNGSGFCSKCNGCCMSVMYMCVCISCPRDLSGGTRRTSCASVGVDRVQPAAMQRIVFCVACSFRMCILLSGCISMLGHKHIIIGRMYCL